ncbi:anti-sigma F factor antagonist [Anaeropeptidivorans aminofermentans]|uniref:anti-sigma F factor antagonist n=1 Tax=Anaeropeptidivorans aminofermentans TaxID=2934315 RepID=UPI0020254497|nr:anti-sigma F factor antagonist [Anaeropeptidivorans aminofermentans]MBE6012504.1 anti-sigma F factor antagonist [Lachnospiraceae bacterium]
MDIATKTVNRNLIVNITGDIDHHSSDEIRNKIDKDIKRNNIKNIIFDFSNVSFMDSSGIGVIIGRYKLVEKQGGQVIACCIDGNIKRIFDVSGLSSILKTYKSCALALEALGGK